MKSFVLTRTGDIDSNMSTVGQGLSGGLGKLTRAGSVVFVLHNDAGAVRSYVFTGDDAVAVQGADDIARYVGACATQVDGVQFRRPGEALAVLRARVWQHLGFSSPQFGADPAQVARQLAPSLDPGDWIAVVARRRGWFEERRYRRYVKFLREGQIQHYSSTSQGCVVASVFAGAADGGRARMLVEAVAAAWPGFDVECDGVVVSARSRLLSGFVAAVVAVGLGVASQWWQVPVFGEYVWLFMLAGGLCLLVGGLCALWVWWRFRGRLPVPRRVWLPRLRGRKPGGDGSSVGRSPMYPLVSWGLFVAPYMVAFPFAPQAGSVSGSSVSRARVVPSVMRAPVGPLVGVAGGEPVWLCDQDVAGGVAVVGSPGVGKSVFLQGLVGYIFARQAREGVSRPFAPHRGSGLVVFETSYQGFTDYIELYENVSSRIGAPNRLIPVVAVDPGSQFSVCLIPEHYSPVQVAQLLTDGLEYSAERGSVGSQSREALMSALTAAAYVDEDVLVRARVLAESKGVPGSVLESGRSVVSYAHVLLTGAGDQVGGFLAQALSEKLMAGDDGLRRVGASLATIWGTVTPAQRRSYTQAPRNKLARLLLVDHLFNPVAVSGQVKVSLRQVVCEHLNLLLLTGSDAAGHIMPDDTEKLVSALVSFCLQECVEQSCNGWYDAGLSTTIVVDELSTMAEFSEHTLDWNRNKGRKYGVRPVYATQNPRQLSDELRRTLLTFPVFVSFKADEVSIGAEIAQKFATDGSEWTGHDVINMAPYSAHVLASFGRTPAPGFTVESVWWRDGVGGVMREEYERWITM